MTKRANIDPVFALIERHRSAVIAWQKPLHDAAVVPYGTAENQRLEKIARPFGIAVVEVEEALGEIIPTSMAGVLALIKHIDDVNLDRVVPAKNRLSGNCGTDLHDWPDDEYAHQSGKRRGRHRPMETWPFRVLRNIATALERIEASKNSKHHRRAA